MKIHLVGGFLGSGKTTAIANATKILSDKNVTTSVITNDQGNYLVDSRFIEKSGISFAEVTGGCFCCNYNSLDSQISLLKKEFYPSAIFAEFVGSCTDLIATVLKPLIEYRPSEIEQVTFSSFVDSRLMLSHLKGDQLPFGDATNYIWEKQIEEAEILIVNKIDLLSIDELKALQELIKDSYLTKQILFQNSLDHESISKWIEVIDDIEKSRIHKSIEVDYIKYGAGEANLAWLDEEIEFITKDNSSVALAYEFIRNLSAEIVKRELPIGHMKFFLAYNDKSEKVSYTTVLDKKNVEPITNEKSNSVDVLVNARIQTSPDELKEILFGVLNQIKSLEGVTINEKFLSYFQPGFPNPTHRIA
jgi:G3E family GTPase